MYDLQALNERVIIRPLATTDTTAGGIYLPEAVRDKSTQGEVIAVGPGRYAKNGKLIPLEVKPGDRVIYSKWGGTEILINNEKLMVLVENEVMAVIKR